MLGSVTADVLGLLAGFLSVAYLFLTWNFDYWEKRGVPYVKPWPLVGNFARSFTGKILMWETLNPFYEQFKQNRYGGIFQMKQPVLLVCDPDLVKQVMTKDFSNFHDRGQPFDEKADPTNAHLFNLNGLKWKNMRARLSPTFTSGKMKLMFPLMVKVADEMKDMIRTEIRKEKQHEMKDILIRFSTDVIGSCAFGVDCNALKDKNSEFYCMVQSSLKSNVFFLIRYMLIAIHPIFASLIPGRWGLSKVTDFFVNLMKETVEFREKNQIHRNDFVSLMMQLREDAKKETDHENHIEFTHEVMTAQALVFFVAGQDGIASNVAFCLHELAQNPALQDQAVSEVQQVLKRHGGEVTYEAAQEMQLLDRILCEGLRKWHPSLFLSRQPTVSSPYTIPGTDVTVDNNCVVFIPVWQMHHDAEYYPDPDRFDPDRFTEEAKKQRHSHTFLPFGEGPRMCIAQRFAMLEMKVALATLLVGFSWSFGPKTDPGLKFDPAKMTTTPKAGFWFSIEERPIDSSD